MKFSNASNKFKIIRTAYNISQTDLSHLTLPISSISNAAIANWEIEKRVPTLDNLKVYVSLFGISLDWLAGISSHPYTEDSIQYGELKLFEILGHNTDTIPYLNANDEFKTFKWDYMYPEDREKCFSLEVRANILTLLWILYASPSWQRMRLNENLEAAILNKRPNTSKSKAAQAKEQSYHDSLLKLLSTHRLTPLYIIPTPENENTAN